MDRLSALWQRLTAAVKQRKILSTAVALLALAGFTLVVTDVTETGPDGKPRHTITIKLGGPGHVAIPLTPSAQAIAKSQAAQDKAGNEQGAESQLQPEPDASQTPAVQKRDAKLQPKGQPDIPAQVPQAAVEQPGCQTTLVRNFSGRGGSPVLLGVIHYTSSVDHGWAGVLANVSWFDNPASQASSNYIIDRKIGACALAVGEASKAWTQAGFNRVAVSVEVTANGSEGSLVVGPGRARLIQLMRGWHDRWKIPYRHGKVSGCSVVRTGFVMHADLGQCGGGHVDVKPYEIDGLIAEAAQGSAASRRVSSVDKVTCRKLTWWRTHGRPHGLAERRAVARRRALAKRQVRCVRGVAHPA